MLFRLRETDSRWKAWAHIICAVQCRSKCVLNFNIVKFWLCYSIWLFYPYSTVKIQPFSPAFPLAESKIKAFCRLIHWNFKKKHQPFSLPQLKNKDSIVCYNTAINNSSFVSEDWHSISCNSYILKKSFSLFELPINVLKKALL